MGKIKFILFISIIGLASCKKDANSTIFYWDETGCSDPWKTDSDYTTQEGIESIKLYLKDQKVDVESIIYEFDQNKQQGCEACSCTSGRIIVVNVSGSDKRKMKKLNFYQKPIQK